MNMNQKPNLPADIKPSDEKNKDGTSGSGQSGNKQSDGNSTSGQAANKQSDMSSGNKKTDSQ